MLLILDDYFTGDYFFGFVDIFSHYVGSRTRKIKNVTCFYSVYWKIEEICFATRHSGINIILCCILYHRDIYSVFCVNKYRQL